MTGCHAIASTDQWTPEGKAIVITYGAIFLFVLLAALPDIKDAVASWWYRLTH